MNRKQSVCYFITSTFLLIFKKSALYILLQKLSINGDLEYLNKCKKYPHPIYIKAVPANTTGSALNGDDDDVEPLPLDVEIKVQQTKI